MKVVWTDPALKDRENIINFIAEENPYAAVEMDSLFTSAGKSLEKMPDRGRVGRVIKTRELVIHKHYLIVYSIDLQCSVVYIKAIVHTSRKYPPI